MKRWGKLPLRLVNRTGGGSRGRKTWRRPLTFGLRWVVHAINVTHPFPLVIYKFDPQCLRPLEHYSFVLWFFSSVPRAPGEPPDLVHKFLISNSNITSKLSWESPASEGPITSYRVTWGPVLHSHHSNPVMDKASTFTKVLSKVASLFHSGYFYSAFSS